MKYTKELYRAHLAYTATIGKITAIQENVIAVEQLLANALLSRENRSKKGVETEAEALQMARDEIELLLQSVVQELSMMESTVLDAMVAVEDGVETFVINDGMLDYYKEIADMWKMNIAAIEESLAEGEVPEELLPQAEKELKSFKAAFAKITTGISLQMPVRKAPKSRKHDNVSKLSDYRKK